MEAAPPIVRGAWQARSQFWAGLVQRRVLAQLHQVARKQLGRKELLPSAVVMDTHLARGASHGGATSHRRGGPYGTTKGAKRAVAVDITGLPLAARVLPASAHENDTTRLLLEDMARQGQSERLTTVKVDRGARARAARSLAKANQISVQIVGHNRARGKFVPLPFAFGTSFLDYGVTGARCNGGTT